MRKIILIFFFLLSSMIFSEDKVIVKSYYLVIPMENKEEEIMRDAEDLIKEYSKKEYEFISLDMAGTRNKIFVAYRFRKE